MTESLASLMRERSDVTPHLGLMTRDVQVAKSLSLLAYDYSSGAWREARMLTPEPEISPAVARDRIIARHARAVQAISEVQDRGGKGTPEQDRELDAARRVLDAIRPHASDDAEKAYVRDPSLVLEAAAGDSRRAREQIAIHRDVRDPKRRADKFVERWTNSVPVANALMSRVTMAAVALSR